MFHADYEPSTWIPYIVVFLDFLKGVAWPFAAIGIAILFSGEIKQMIPKIGEVGPKGVRIDPPDQNETGPTDIADEQVSTVKLDPLIDPAAIELEASTRTALGKLPETEKEERLIRALTFAQLHKAFAMVYSNIFGSQIRALKELNTRPIGFTEASEMFEELQLETPALSSWTIDEYLSYLIRWQLIERDSIGYHITESGRSFLRFIVDSGLSENRAN